MPIIGDSQKWRKTCSLWLVLGVILFCQLDFIHMKLLANTPEILNGIVPGLSTGSTLVPARIMMDETSTWVLFK